MAIITQRLEVCDVCKDTNLPVIKVRLAVGDGRLHRYALCDKHGRGVLELLPTLPAAGAPVTRRRRSSQVSMEEVAASRTAAPARTRKAVAG